MPQQTTAQLLMIRPANFGFNKETAINNAFQQEISGKTSKEISQQAQAEFDQLVALLRSKGIQVVVVEDSELPVKTDAVFPNNWISFHENGSLATYPMWSPHRRLERRADLVAQLQAQFGYTQRFSLEHLEAEHIFLEGTGSLLLDRVHKLCYACRSVRTHEVAVDLFCAHYGYQKVLFDAVDDQGQAIYHTNVLMALGEDFVVIGLESLPKAEERQRLLALFEQTNKTVVPLTWAQIQAFAGNMLQVRNSQDATFLVLSQQARGSLTATQVQVLEEHTTLLSSPIPTIETLGGGSVRCMMAEVFLPQS